VIRGRPGGKIEYCAFRSPNWSVNEAVHAAYNSRGLPRRACHAAVVQADTARWSSCPVKPSGEREDRVRPDVLEHTPQLLNAVGVVDGRASAVGMAEPPVLDDAEGGERRRELVGP
jgi:hypothetical protein